MFDPDTHILFEISKLSENQQRVVSEVLNCKDVQNLSYEDKLYILKCAEEYVDS